MQKAYTGTGTHIDVKQLNEQDFSCLNYLAFTAIDHARGVCTAVKTRARTVPPAKKTGEQSPLPADYVHGAPAEWWSSEAAKYCPKNTVCLPGPKIELQPNPQVGVCHPPDHRPIPPVFSSARSAEGALTSSLCLLFLVQVQFIAVDGGGDAYEEELRYSNDSFYYDKGCLFGAQGVSLYDIAQVWQATFPKSSIDTCAAALISTQATIYKRLMIDREIERGIER